MRITKEERLCSIHIGHNVKDNSTDNASFFVLAFEEKRVERPHLLDGFSPLLGFPGHILCLFVDGVYYFCFLFLTFQLFHTI